VQDTGIVTEHVAAQGSVTAKAFLKFRGALDSPGKAAYTGSVRKDLPPWPQSSRPNTLRLPGSMDSLRAEILKNVPRERKRLANQALEAT